MKIVQDIKRISCSLLHVRFVQDVLTLQVERVATYALGIVSSVVVARTLGLEAYGVYTIALALKETLGITHRLGQGQSCRIFLSEHYSARDREGMNAVLKYYIQLASLAIGIQFALMILSPKISMLMYGDNQIGVLAALALLAGIAATFHEIVYVTLQTVREVKLMTALHTSSIMLQLVFTLLALALGYKAEGILIGQFISNMIMLVCLYLFLHRVQRKYNVPGFREALASKSSTRPYLLQGLWIATHKNLTSYFIPSTLLIMSFFAPHGTIGIAKIAYKLALVPKTLLVQHTSKLADTVLPGIKAKGMQAIRSYTATLIKHTLAFHALLCFGAMVVFPPIVLFLYGWEYSDAITPMLWLLLIQLIRGITVVNSTIYRMLRKTHIPVIWNGSIAVAQLVIFVFLLRTTEPLTAFVLTILLHNLGELVLSWYMNHRLLVVSTATLKNG